MFLIGKLPSRCSLYFREIYPSVMKLNLKQHFPFIDYNNSKINLPSLLTSLKALTA